jgi:hypothetical protein
MKFYAGIGGRQTPDNILEAMRYLGQELCRRRYRLRTGNCKGADQAFQDGANYVAQDHVHLYLPWATYNDENIIRGNKVFCGELMEWDYSVASTHHPAWDRCSQDGKLYHIRNTQIILGENYGAQVEFVICWTADEEKGGTSQGIRVARVNQIPVHNLFWCKNEDELDAKIDEILSVIDSRAKTFDRPIPVEIKWNRK